MKAITVFTTTYNRAFCLPQLYQSLVHQTSQNFLWLVVDDGSTDDTNQLIQHWITENKIAIKYIFQENQGMHSGHNTAYQNIDTLLNVCIDSDDYMPSNAVELILKNWELYKNENIAGFIGLDSYKNGEIIGSKFPELLKRTKLSDVYLKHKIIGDKKLVIKTSVVKEFPQYPIFKEERLVPLGTLYLMIDQKYDWICTNDVYCIVEYLEEGSSRNILRQYKKSPKGFGYSRLIEMKYSKSIFYSFSRAVHYISSCLFQRKLDFFTNNPKKLITLFAIPFGILFHLFLLFKIRK
ncbi:glycosyltransferase family A protein [Flavobacterium sp.]|uniref:glycosyltransferase family 2 protein n=1 Tax=Flavobacterium sp. TaxID=239 RepID=UPI002636A45C|nr:glycosyltransferase family A protein [Flavobacterium sp.]